MQGKISPGKGLFQDAFSTPLAEMPVSHATVHQRLIKFLTTQQSRSPYQSHSEHTLSPAGRWAVYEWFYADVDRPFFQQNEFQDCLNELDLAKVRKLTRLEWSHVRASMGKPRRLSPAFLNQERAKLGHTRIGVRHIRAGQGSPGEPFPQDIPPKLLPGATIIALHNHFVKRGIIHQSAEDGSQYVVQLEGSPFPETVKDTEIMAAVPDEYEVDITSVPQSSQGMQHDSSSKRRKPGKKELLVLCSTNTF